MTEETMLNLNRVTSFSDSLRAYIIVLDGEEFGQIRAGESFNITISPGEHQIFLKIDWCRSNILVFTARPGAEISLNCGSSLTGWRILLAYLYIFLWRDQYLWIREGPKIVSMPPRELPTISKRMKLVLLIVFVIYALSFVIEPVMRARLELLPQSVSPQSLTIMKGIGIFLSILGLIMPWVIQRFLSRKSMMMNRSRQETLTLLFGYIFLISPIIYGLTLFHSGIPLAELYYFVGASIIMGIGWGTYNYVNG